MKSTKPNILYHLHILNNYDNLLHSPICPCNITPRYVHLPNICPKFHFVSVVHNSGSFYIYQGNYKLWY
ncbi:hypothetical protein XELAEV_18005194mg [Xenopus laevis]|uniref:Uncharacterized protein n=1 Tax=Xenopus laevis TaxID=8355 RepID=A0A974DWF2_XENLA|nr:hypothetical protein XELAEV_18005194mg [Xenopus laevis]